MPKLAVKIGGGVIAALVLVHFYMSSQCAAQAARFDRAAKFGFTSGCLMETPYGVWVPLKRHTGSGAAGGGHH